MKTIKLFWICLSICLFSLNFNLFAQSTVPILRLNTEMHMNNIMKVSTDAQGKHLLTTSFDKTAKLWNAQTGELIRTFRPPINYSNEGILWGGAISPDGSIVAVGGVTGFTWDKKASVYIFNCSTGKLIQRIKGYNAVIFDIEFSLNGRYLAAALGHGGVVIHKTNLPDIENLDFVKHKTLSGYNSKTYNVTFSSSGKFASVCTDGKIRLYDKYFNLTNETTGAGGEPYSICFSPDEQKLAVGYIDNSDVEVFSTSSLQVLYRPKIDGLAEKQGFPTICFSADGNFLYGGGNYAKDIDGYRWNVIRLWTNAGQGAYSDYPACDNLIADIKSVKNDNSQSLFFCSWQPDFGKLDSYGSRTYYKTGELNDFKNGQFQYFKINYSGDKITYKSEGDKEKCFSVKERSLVDIENQSDLKSYSDKKSGISVTDWFNTDHPKINNKSSSFLGESNDCLSVDIANDGEKIVFGSDMRIFCTDKLGNTIWETPKLMQNVHAVNISKDGKVVASAQTGGIINWYSMKDGEHLLTLYVHPNRPEWIMYTPSGLFDCSPGAESLAGWHINQGPDKEAKFYPLSQFYEKYYIPNLGARILGGEIINMGNDLLANMKLPPLVEILSPKNALESNSKKIQVSVKITDQGGGVDNVQLYLNDKLIEVSHLDFKSADTNAQSVTKTFDIAIVHGANRIRATAFNKQRTESIPHEITVFHEGSIHKTNLHLLAIGVNEYKNPRYQLNYAEADASSFLNEVKNGCNGVYENISITYIKNEEATRTRIVQEFERLKSTAQQEDVFIFYYAGHGVMSEESKSRFYMVPYDVTQMYGNIAMLQSKGISANELKTFSTELKAQKQLFVIDACQSGGMTELLASRGAAKEKAIAQLARSTGTYWITASKSEQFASEFASLGHGIFTYAILQGLKGDADGGTKDKKITVKELSRFLNDKVPELSEKYKGEAQYPTTYVYGQDFPIVIIK